MTPEIDTYSRYTREMLARIHAALQGLSAPDLNRAPDLPGANSGYVIATRVLGNMRAWVLGIGCGHDLRRDRPAEFASRGTYEELGVAACKLSGEIEAALAALDPARLDERLVPAQDLWGEGEAHEIARRDSFAHVLEHAGIHLGEVLMTRALLAKGR
jgi:hypothetical protein